MPSYIEYTMEDGSTLLVETEEVSGGLIKASRDGLEVVTTGRSFTEALAGIRCLMKALTMEIEALQVQEAEITFGLKAVGEAGIFAVGKVGGETNCAVTLKWKAPDEKKKQSK